jgi:ABC-type transport system involved in multi-copper enzyme maturation permease subunit
MVEASLHPWSARGRVFFDGLWCGLSAMVSRETRAGSRGWRFTLLLTGYLLALAAFVAGYLALADNTELGTSPELGLQLFSILALAAVLLLAFITISVSAGSISGELERRTLDLMLVTRASALGLVTGKLAGAMVHVLFLLIASMPAFSLVFLFGGVPTQYFILFFIVATATAVSHAAIGLLLSAWLRRTILASALAFVVVLGVVAGLPIAGAIAGARDQEQVAVAVAMSMSSSQYAGWQTYGPFPITALQHAGRPRTFAYASPLVALASVLPAGGSGDVGTMVWPALQLFVVGTSRAGESGISLWRAVYVERINPASGQPEIRTTWAPWIFYVGLAVVLVPAVLLLAAAGLSPRRQRKTPATRRRRKEGAA